MVLSINFFDRHGELVATEALFFPGYIPPGHSTRDLITEGVIG